jgi:hypothetical protein
MELHALDISLANRISRKATPFGISAVALRQKQSVYFSGIEDLSPRLKIATNLRMQEL